MSITAELSTFVFSSRSVSICTSEPIDRHETIGQDTITRSVALPEG